MSLNKSREGSYEKNIAEWNLQLAGNNIATSHFENFRHGHYKSICIMGIGGSGLAGDIVASVRHEIGLRVPVIIWKEYDLPPANTPGLEDPLYIFVSFSGNTEETLSGLTELLRSKNNAKNVAVVATGGALESLARLKKIPFARFSAGSLTPRQGTGNMFYSLVRILHGAGFPVKAPVFPKLNPGTFRTLGRTLAKKFKGRLLLFYTDEAFRPVGYIWKIKMNETAKTLAFANVVPEMNHNEIVGFEKLRTKTTAVFFLHNDLHPRLKKRIRVNELLLKKLGVRAHTVTLSGKTKLEKIWNALVLGEWVAFFLAELRGVDPKETKLVAQLKQLMKQ